MTWNLTFSTCRRYQRAVLLDRSLIRLAREQANYTLQNWLITMVSRKERSPPLKPLSGNKPLKAPGPAVRKTKVEQPPRTRRKSQYWLYFFTLFFFFAALQSFRSFQLSDLLEPGKEKTVLLLTAHPDDEAMFFSPTLLELVAQGWDVRGLCLSTGKSGLRLSLVSAEDE